ncbi:KH domain-containing protein [Granulicella tundricola]|uniref:Uncharacterized protein n=1 Tax=Granulicella tundricola (strain ATCC BAA-1859 / DSM 23138 / MP5ACTX9) TaxID=1198114 RepID=E8X7K2_GRATM|nr:hypothetical protein AciX9_4491 [Granulicella tundricola MP5ACTX9]
MSAGQLEAHAILTRIVRALVRNPDAVNIEIRLAHTTTFVVTVAASDVAKVVGKQGATAKALRTFLYAMGAQMKTPFALSIKS